MRRRWIRIEDMTAQCPYCSTLCSFLISADIYKQQTGQLDEGNVCIHYVGKARKYSSSFEFAVFTRLKEVN